MSRLRVSTSPSEGDRVISSHLDRAIREIEAATQVARQAKTTHRSARRTERDLSRALEALHSVGTMAPQGGVDPDAISEDERNKMHREKMAQERKDRRDRRDRRAEAAEVTDE